MAAAVLASPVLPLVLVSFTPAHQAMSASASRTLILGRCFWQDDLANLCDSLDVVLGADSDDQ